MKHPLLIVLSIFLALTFSLSSVSAQEAALTEAESILAELRALPEEDRGQLYELALFLAERYIAMTEIAHRAIQLSEESDRSVEALLAQLEQVTEQLKVATATIEEQSRVIEELARASEEQNRVIEVLSKTLEAQDEFIRKSILGRRFGLEAGVHFNGLNPITIEPYLAVTLRF